MAQINKPDDYFNTVLYTGNGSTQSITGVGFQPDWLWLKSRSQVVNHYGFDAVRGVTKGLSQNTTSAESTKDSTWVTSFDSDGFSLGSEANINNSSSTYVSWNWLANGTGASNTDGSITSTVSANTTSGFSIVSYTGTGANATVGHGLNAVPKMIICKNRIDAETWGTYHVSIGATKYLGLNLNQGTSTSSTPWNDTEPTSSVFSLGSWGAVNGSGDNCIAYCFAEKKGFSKFGSYTGNGSTDGTFVYTGFKPAFIIVKRTDSTGSWLLMDNKRDTFNVCDAELLANDSFQETLATNLDILSNGFKLRTTGAEKNASGGSYIYMAFAENPLVGTNNIPATAR